MSDKDLLLMVLKIIDYLNDCDTDAFEIDLKAPDGGKLKCHFHYTVELQEDNNDN